MHCSVLFIILPNYSPCFNYLLPLCIALSYLLYYPTTPRASIISSRYALLCPVYYTTQLLHVLQLSPPVIHCSVLFIILPNYSTCFNYLLPLYIALSCLLYYPTTPRASIISSRYTLLCPVYYTTQLLPVLQLSPPVMHCSVLFIILPNYSPCFNYLLPLYIALSCLLYYPTTPRASIISSRYALLSPVYYTTQLLHVLQLSPPVMHCSVLFIILPNYSPCFNYLLPLYIALSCLLYYPTTPRASIISSRYTLLCPVYYTTQLLHVLQLSPPVMHCSVLFIILPNYSPCFNYLLPLCIALSCLLYYPTTPRASIISSRYALLCPVYYTTQLLPVLQLSPPVMHCSVLFIILPNYSTCFNYLLPLCIALSCLLYYPTTPRASIISSRYALLCPVYYTTQLLPVLQLSPPVIHCSVLFIILPNYSPCFNYLLPLCTALSCLLYYPTTPRASIISSRYALLCPVYYNTQLLHVLQLSPPVIHCSVLFIILPNYSTCFNDLLPLYIALSCLLYYPTTPRASMISSRYALLCPVYYTTQLLHVLQLSPPVMHCSVLFIILPNYSPCFNYLLPLCIALSCLLYYPTTPRASIISSRYALLCPVYYTTQLLHVLQLSPPVMHCSVLFIILPNYSTCFNYLLPLYIALSCLLYYPTTPRASIISSRYALLCPVYYTTQLLPVLQLSPPVMHCSVLFIILPNYSTCFSYLLPLYIALSCLLYYPTTPRASIISSRYTLLCPVYYTTQLLHVLQLSPPVIHCSVRFIILPNYSPCFNYLLPLCIALSCLLYYPTTPRASIISSRYALLCPVYYTTQLLHVLQLSPPVMHCSLLFIILPNYSTCFNYLLPLCIALSCLLYYPTTPRASIISSRYTLLCPVYYTTQLLPVLQLSPPVIHCSVLFIILPNYSTCFNYLLPLYIALSCLLYYPTTLRASIISSRYALLCPVYYTTQLLPVLQLSPPVMHCSVLFIILPNYSPCFNYLLPLYIALSCLLYYPTTPRASIISSRYALLSPVYYTTQLLHVLQLSPPVMHCSVLFIILPNYSPCFNYLLPLYIALSCLLYYPTTPRASIISSRYALLCPVYYTTQLLHVLQLSPPVMHCSVLFIILPNYSTCFNYLLPLYIALSCLLYYPTTPRASIISSRYTLLCPVYYTTQLLHVLQLSPPVIHCSVLFIILPNYSTCFNYLLPLCIALSCLLYYPTTPRASIISSRYTLLCPVYYTTQLLHVLQLSPPVMHCSVLFIILPNYSTCFNSNCLRLCRISCKVFWNRG